MANPQKENGYTVNTKKKLKNSKIKPPSFQFYPNDWLNDTALAMCSYEAKGLWIELICRMHDTEPYGYLTINGKALDEKEIQKLVKMRPKKFKKTFDELTTYGVIKHDIKNGFYCKRLVEDYALSKLRKECGKLGGNPNLVNRNTTKNKKEVNQTSNQNLTPSSSSSSSIKKEKEKKEKKSEKGKDQIFDNFLTLTEKRKLQVDIPCARYLEMREEYKQRIPFWAEVNKCVNWCYDNGKKKISTSRLRNWMMNAVKFQRENEIKQLQDMQDLKMNKLAGRDLIKTITDKKPVWTPPS